MEIDYAGIRDRLIDLKKTKKMSNSDFCKIYAPEKCCSKSNADNYISALSTGRNYPDEEHGPLLPDLEHLMNIVNSDEFPEVTLDYLVYGVKTPVKTIEKISFDLNKWTLADFCELLWTLKTRYPNSITIENDIEDHLNIYGEPVTEREVVIRIDEIKDSNGKQIEFSLGQALVLFHYEVNDTENSRNAKIRELGFSEAVTEMRKVAPFLDNLSNCYNTPFLRIYGGDEE